MFEEIEVEAETFQQACASKAETGTAGADVAVDGIQTCFPGNSLGVARTSLARLSLHVKDESEFAFDFKTPNSAKEWVRQLRKAAKQIPQKSFWGVLVSVLEL